MISITKKLDFILQESQSIFDAISLINSSPYLIAVVVDSKNRVVGTITDGDIRRGLISGLSISESCNTIMNKDPIVSIEGDSLDQRKSILKANHINQLPITNIDKEIIGLVYHGELITNTICENQMLIMAGGFGKRMQSLTEDTPKPMLLLGDKPILEHIILKAKSYGFRNFLISTHYLSEKIIDYFGNGDRLDVSIDYLQEEKPLGTGGAISLIKESIETPLVITNGDLLIDINYRNLLDFHNQNNADATMAVRKHIIENPFGVVETEGFEIKSITEKPIYESNINAGIYVINNRIKDYIQPKEYIDMPDLFQRLIESKEGFRLLGYPLHEEWLDIGKPSDLSKANKTRINEKN